MQDPSCRVRHETYPVAARLRDEIKRLEQADLGISQEGAVGGGGFASRVAAADAKAKSKKGGAAGKRGRGGKGKGKVKSARPGSDSR